MQHQLVRLQAEKETALAHVKCLQAQHPASISFLQGTVADVQNTATHANNQTNQWATHVDSQLNELKARIVEGQASPQKDFERIHRNIYYLCNRAQESNAVYRRQFPSIEKRHGQLKLHPLMQEPERPQVQVEQLEASVGQYLDAPPPASPPQHQIFDCRTITIHTPQNAK